MVDFTNSNPWNYQFSNMQFEAPPETPYGNFEQPASLGGVGSSYLDFGSDAPVGQMPSGYSGEGSFRSDQAPEQPSWWDRNTSGQLGVDNAFRLGGAALTGLGMVGAVNAGKRQERATDDAINYLNSQRDPNSSFYQAELNRMMRDPNGHLGDVVTQNRVNATRDAIMRQNAAAGRPGQLTADQMRAMQEASHGAYQQRIKTLQDLIAGDKTLGTATANIMANRKTFDPLQAIAPGLQSLFRTGQEYAISQGYASDPRIRRSADAIGLDQRQAEKYSGLL